MHISKDSQSHTLTTILNYESKSLTSRGELPLVQVRNELVWRRFLSYTTPPSSFAKCYLSATSISRGSTPDSTRSMNLWDRHTPLEKEASKGTALRKRKRRKEVEEPKKKKRRGSRACGQDTIMEALSTNRPGIIAARASIQRAHTLLLSCSTTAFDG